MALLALLPSLSSGALVREATAAAKQTRYSLAGGCYALQAPGGLFVAETGGGYSASARSKGRAEPFRMQATTLGRYLLYGSERDFLSIEGDVAVADQPSNATDLTVRSRGRGFTITNESAGRELAAGAGGALVAQPKGDAFTFVQTSGCPRYPEVAVNVRGRPVTGTPRYGEVSGLLEGHLHHMAFEFLGGLAHCGRVWHRFGAPYALRDCPDHEIGGGCAAVLENFLYGDPARCHDPTGWPSFKDWPDPRSLTHEQTYYKWVERAWRGGLRVFVLLTVENRVLCEIYPLKQNSCDEMDSVLLQIKRAYQLQDYIDAQSGGPGKGWYRIVHTPFQARRVINRGKLAVVLGMEVSEPFGCRIQNQNTPLERSTCDEDDVDGWLDRLHRLGVRQLEVINKFDNPISGVAGDGGTTGVVVGGGNLYATGSFWEYGSCEDPEHHDQVPEGIHNDDLILANGIDELLGTSLPPLPIYPENSCNTRGLSELGRHTVRAIMDRGMLFDPDHMSVRGRNQALNVVKRRRYPGIFSSHSWSTDDALPPIYRLGGVVTPYAGGSEGFVHKWEHLRAVRRDLPRAKRRRFYFGVGYGADMNGFGAQGNPRGADVPNPVRYPFKSWDGEVTIRQQRSGTRLYDINTDGVAHYGLYPDWVEDLRRIAGPKILRDMGRGAEAYLQMWERTIGIPAPRCGGWAKQRFTATGLGPRLALGKSAKATLRRAGQPLRRERVWRWCTGAKGSKVAAVFGAGAATELLLSELRGNRAGGIGPGASAAKLRGRASAVGGGVWAAPAGGGNSFVYVVGGGRVTHVGVAAASLVGDGARLARAVRRAAR